MIVTTGGDHEMRWRTLRRWSRMILRLVTAGRQGAHDRVRRGRGAYKQVWTELAETERSAILHVQGDATEEDVGRAGEATVGYLRQTIGLNPDDVFLEIGCGIGRVGMVLAPLCKRWIGCDVSPTMLAHASRRLAHLANVELKEISGHNLDGVDDRSVDAIYCTVVFMHLEEWDRYSYVEEAYRVLRPGGRVFVDNFNLMHDRGWALFDQLRRAFHPLNRPPYISKASTPQEIETYLVRAGFKAVTVRLADEWIQGYGTK